MTIWDFQGCNKHTPVSFVRLNNAGRIWPGVEIELDKHIFGLSSKDLDFNQMFWTFFTQAN